MINFILSLLIMTSIIACYSLLGLKNSITKLALLILLFLTVSGIFLILDFYFLGLTYIIVYVGAIAILFLFVIMLVQTNKSLDGNERPILEVKNENLMIGNINNKLRNKELNLIDLVILDSEKEIKNSVIGGLNMSSIKESILNKSNLKVMVLLVVSVGLLISGLMNSNKELVINENVEMDLYCYFIASWSTDLLTLTDISVLGYSLYLGYPIGVLLLGVLLWIVLIGILCISSRNN